MISDVRHGTLEAAFVSVSGLDQPGLTTVMLASEPVLLACLPDHPLAGRGVVSVGDLADEPFVDYTPGWGTRTVADQVFAQAGIERAIGIEVADGTIHSALVRAGLGVAILPQSYIEAGGLTGVPLRPATMFRVAFIAPADRPLSPVTQAFLDMVEAAHQRPSA
jgi:DNA-binding transcriptional LysR family regulator